MEDGEGGWNPPTPRVTPAESLALPEGRTWDSTSNTDPSIDWNIAYHVVYISDVRVEDHEAINSILADLPKKGELIKQTSGARVIGNVSKDDYGKVRMWRGKGCGI